MYDCCVITSFTFVQAIVYFVFCFFYLSYCCLFSAGTEDSNSREPSREDPQSLGASQSSSGLEPSGLDHSGEEQDSASSVKEPETTAPADARERPVGSEFEITKQTRYLFT